MANEIMNINNLNLLPYQLPCVAFTTRASNRQLTISKPSIKPFHDGLTLALHVTAPKALYKKEDNFVLVIIPGKYWLAGLSDYSVLSCGFGAR